MALSVAIAIAATIVLYLVFYALTALPALERRRNTIAGVLAKRALGVVILGGGAALAAWLFLPFSPAQLGVVVPVPPTTWAWVAAASVVIVIGCLLTAHKPENFDVYPEMRVPLWGVGPVAANFVSCLLYMLAYEFLFRGFLFFACLAIMPAWLAIAVNAALYALAHVPKGRREALGSIPLGVVVCLASIETGAIWAAFLIHVIMSQLNDYLAVRGNPAMRFGFGGATP
ncbi:MAG: CPBP family intramembrane metalloprotease [Bauldia sp.]|nr:CPBP family intramembrane metalloprotease [Bauldia sp.]